MGRIPGGRGREERLCNGLLIFILFFLPICYRKYVLLLDRGVDIFRSDMERTFVKHESPNRVILCQMGSAPVVRRLVWSWSEDIIIWRLYL